MAKKNSLLKFKSISAGDMSGDITSAVTQIEYLDNVGYQFNFTGTPVGVFSIEVSIDHAQDSQGVVTDPGNWIPIDLPTSPVASGAAGSIYIDLNQLSAPWVRAKYTATSGSGTLNAFIAAKAV